MQRRVLEEERIHPAIREKLATHRAAMVDAVERALAEHDVVVVGMKQNPYPRKARTLLERNAIAYHYLEYGSYLSQWKERLALKLWTGWPTFPMIFVRGVLIGGFRDLERQLETGELTATLAAARS